MLLLMMMCGVGGNMSGIWWMLSGWFVGCVVEEKVGIGAR